MRTIAMAVLAAALVLATNAEPAQAQSRPQTREGFFIGFGFGWGSLGCSDCSGERESGLSGYFKLGAAVNQRVLLGFESNGWFKEQSGVTLSQGNGSAVIYLYPNPESGFFIKGGIGLATLNLDVSGFGSDNVTGFGLVGGLGYDARVGRNFSLTPFGNFVYGSFDGGSTNVIQAGIGLTWH